MVVIDFLQGMLYALGTLSFVTTFRYFICYRADALQVSAGYEKCARISDRLSVVLRSLQGEAPWRYAVCSCLIKITETLLRINYSQW